MVSSLCHSLGSVTLNVFYRGAFIVSVRLFDVNTRPLWHHFEREQKAYVTSQSGAESLPFAFEVHSVTGRYGGAQRSLFQLNVLGSVVFDPKVLSKGHGILRRQCIRCKLPESKVMSVVCPSCLTDNDTIT